MFQHGQVQLGQHHAFTFGLLCQHLAPGVDGDALRALGFETLDAPADEPFAANFLRVDDRVLANTAAPRTLARIREAWRARGHAPEALFETPLVEFGKAEAGLTCLSLVYSGQTSK